MNILFETTWLAPGGFQAAADVRVNGQQIVDDASFFQAAAMAFYPRGNLSDTLAFSTKWQFSTPTAAEVFALTLPTMVPMSASDSGVVQCICGNAPNAQTVYMNNAVLESVRVIKQIGTSVEVAYVLKGPGFQTDIPPDVPGYPDPGELTLVYRRATVPIPSGVGSLAVAFSSPFNTAPVIVPCMCGVSGSPALFARLLSNTVTTNGFTVEFSDLTPDDTYTLTYFALQ